MNGRMERMDYSLGAYKADPKHVIVAADTRRQIARVYHEDDLHMILNACNNKDIVKSLAEVKVAEVHGDGDVVESWVNSSTKRQDVNDVEILVAHKDFTAEDYAKAIAEVREVFRRNKDRRWVLQILEEHIADSHLQRTAK